MSSGQLENVSSVISFAKPECANCPDMRKFIHDCLEARNELTEKADDPLLIARFAGFAVLCPRNVAFPPADCEQGPCSTIPPDRKCELGELTEMTPESRQARIQLMVGLG
jgi:hypothetical protein